MLEKVGCKIKTINLKYTSLGVSLIKLLHQQNALPIYLDLMVAYGHRSGNSSDLENLYRESRSEGFGKEVKRRILVGTYAFCRVLRCILLESSKS